MNQEIKDKLAKVYELVNRGVEGEKEAAKAALDRMFKKYNLTEADLYDLTQKRYRFKYSTKLDEWLFIRLVGHLLNIDNGKAFKDTWGKREIVMQLEYLDYVMLESAYEYFRRHMKKEYNRVVLPQVKRCRTTRTRNKRRNELQQTFFTKYVIASGLYKPAELIKVDTSKMSQKARADSMSMRDVKGGNYKTQMTTGLYLD